MEIEEKKESLLKRQVEKTSQLVNESVAPPSLGYDVVNIPLEELKSKFPKRYEIYLQLLRETQGDAKIDEEQKCRMSIWLRTLNNLDEYIFAHNVEEDSRTLYSAQMGVFEDLRNFLEKGKTEGYIKLPTGFGKTVLFTEFVEATDLKTLIVVPTKILVDQTQEKFQQFAQSIDLGKIYSEKKDYDKNVTVTTYDSLNAGISNGTINPLEYDLLILDEAHRSLSDKRIGSIKQFRNAFKIGFTATPTFSIDKKVDNLLPEKIHEMTIKEAVEHGMLSSFSAYIAETDVDLSKVSITSSGEYNEAELEKAINIQSRNMAAVDFYERAFKDKTTVAYCVTIKHAEDLARLFNERGISAAVISGKHSKKEQEELRRKFKSREIKILCNADLLIEGFDEPHASVCLNLRPTLSQVVAEQRGGRVLRLDFEDSNKHAYIIDFIDKAPSGKNHSISFAEVAGGAFVAQQSDHDQEAQQQTFRDKIDSISIEGLKVITNPLEVLTILQERNLEWLSTSEIADRYELSRAEIYSLCQESLQLFDQDNFEGSRQESRTYRNKNMTTVKTETVWNPRIVSVISKIVEDSQREKQVNDFKDEARLRFEDRLRSKFPQLLPGFYSYFYNEILTTAPEFIDQIGNNVYLSLDQYKALNDLIDEGKRKYKQTLIKSYEENLNS